MDSALELVGAGVAGGAPAVHIGLSGVDKTVVASRLDAGAGSESTEDWFTIATDAVSMG